MYNNSANLTRKTDDEKIGVWQTKHSSATMFAFRIIRIHVNEGKTKYVDPRARVILEGFLSIPKVRSPSPPPPPLLPPLIIV